MKQFLKVFFLCVMLVCLGALTVLAADAAVGTEAELVAAINAANDKTASSTPTTVTLTGNVTLGGDATISVAGKHVVIDGQGKYKISRTTITTADFLFVLTGGADLTLQNVTVDTYANVVSLPASEGAFFTLGAGGKITATIPTNFTDDKSVLGNEPILIYDFGGNTVTIGAGASMGFESVTVKARTIGIYSAGVVHVYGKLYDGVNADTTNHRNIYAYNASAELYIYEGAEVISTGNGGGGSTALVWTNAKKVHITGGTFTATNWKNDTTTGNIPVGFMYINTSAAVADVDYLISGGTFTVAGPAGTGMIQFNCNASRSFTVSGGEFNLSTAGTMLRISKTDVVNVTGGTFNHSGEGQMLQMPSTGVFNMTGGTLNHTAAKNTIQVTGNATLTFGGDAKVYSKHHLLWATSCSPAVTVKDNAVLSTTHTSGNVLRFEAGKPVVNISGNAQLLGKATAFLYYNLTTGDNKDTTGFVTLNISGTPLIDSYNTCIYIESPNVTDSSIYNVLNITGGTFKSEVNFGINLKNGTRVSLTALKNATFETINCCFNVSQVTFKQTDLVFENCTFDTTSGEYYINAGGNHTNLRTPIRIGVDDDHAVTLNSLTLKNCNLLSNNEGLSVAKASTVGSIVVNTTGEGNYTYNGLFQFLNTAAVPTVAFNLGGTGTVTFAGLEVTNAGTAAPLITVSGVCELLVTDRTTLTKRADTNNGTAAEYRDDKTVLTQTGDAAVLLVSAAATVTVNGSTTVTTTGAKGDSHGVFVLDADCTLDIGGDTKVNATGVVVFYSTKSPVITVSGLASLSSDTWCFSLWQGKPVVTVSGGTLTGNYVYTYNNRSDRTSEDGFGTLIVKGGKLVALSTGKKDCVYFNSTNSAKNVLTVTSGTFDGQDALNVLGSTVLEVNISGGTFNALTRYVFNIQGSSNVTMDIKGGSFSASTAYIFMVQSTAKATVNVGAVKMTTTDAAGYVLYQTSSTPSNFTFEGTTINAAGYAITAEGSGKPVVTLKGCTVSVDNGALGYFEVAGPVATIRAENTVITGSRGFMLNNGGALNLTLVDCQTTMVNQLIRSYGDSLLTANITGGKHVSTGSQVFGINGVKESVVNLYSGIYKTTSGVGPLYIGGQSGYTTGGLTFNIYGGFFECTAGRICRLYNNCTLNIYGGTYYKAKAGETPLFDVSVMYKELASTLNVHGGLFYGVTPDYPMILSNDLGTVNIKGGNFHGAAAPLINFGKGTASFNHTAGNYTTVSGLDMKSGSTLRLVSNSSGLRFVTNISKAAYDRLAALADNGELTFGTLIMPAQYMEWAATYMKQFTKEALDTLGLQYLNIQATSTGLRQNADGSYTMSAAIAGIKAENIELSFAALSYVTFKVNGVTVTQYSNYNATKNARSAYQVARAAANDISATEQGDYVYEIMSNGNSAYVGQYSPYTKEQWNVIGRYWEWNDTTKSEVKTIDLFGIAGQSNASGYSNITDSFKSTHGSTKYTNIFYSGATPLYLTASATLSTGTSKDIIKLDATQYLPGTTPVTIGLGWKAGTQIGSEFGIASILASTYKNGSDKYAGIVKFAVGGTSLTDEFSTTNNTYGGNWCPPSYLAEKGKVGAESGMLYNHFIHHMGSAVEDYRAMGYVVNIKGVFWMQGEADRNKSNITTNYPIMFKALVEDMRADFYEMTPYNNSVVEFVVGEITTACGDQTSTSNVANTKAFVTMQGKLDEIAGLPGISVINSGKYTTTQDNYHWPCDVMYEIGRLAGNAFMN